MQRASRSRHQQQEAGAYTIPRTGPVCGGVGHRVWARMLKLTGCRFGVRLVLVDPATDIASQVLMC